MRGTVTAVVRKREGQNGGFGFLRDETGESRFFHARNMVGGSPAFEVLNEGAAVEFEPMTVPSPKNNGLRADRVQVV